MAALPGVRHVGWGSVLPMNGSYISMAFQVDGEPPKPVANQDSARYQIVTSTYFETLDLPILAGRNFNRGDRPDSPPVAIVNEAFVRQYLAGRDPLRTRIEVRAMHTGGGKLPIREIVGVVRQARERPDEPEGASHIYVPLAQDPWLTATLVVQPSTGPAAALAPAVRAAVARVDRDRPVTQVRTLDEIAAGARAAPRFRTVLISTFALLALLLAMVGVFGVLAYSVQQRWREFGIRIALGATTANVLRLVFGSAGRMIAVGGAIGLVAAAALSGAIASFLFGVQPLDPLTFVSVAAVLALTATVATMVPALRAARVDPVEAFRSE